MQGIVGAQNFTFGPQFFQNQFFNPKILGKEDFLTAQNLWGGAIPFSLP